MKAPDQVVDVFTEPLKNNVFIKIRDMLELWRNQVQKECWKLNSISSFYKE